MTRIWVLGVVSSGSILCSNLLIEREPVGRRGGRQEPGPPDYCDFRPPFVIHTLSRYSPRSLKAAKLEVCRSESRRVRHLPVFLVQVGEIRGIRVNGTLRAFRHSTRRE